MPCFHVISPIFPGVPRGERDFGVAGRVAIHYTFTAVSSRSIGDKGPQEGEEEEIADGEIEKRKKRYPRQPAAVARGKFT